MAKKPRVGCRNFSSKIRVVEQFGLKYNLTIKFNLSSFLDDDVIGYEKFQTISLYQEQDRFRPVSRQQQDRFRNKLFCCLFVPAFWQAFLSGQYKCHAILSMQYKSQCTFLGGGLVG